MSAFIVITKEHSRDADASGRYVEQHESFTRGHALVYRARFGRYEVLEGAATEGLAILEFPTFELAKAWYASPLYQAASRDRYLGGDYRAILVDGVR